MDNVSPVVAEPTSIESVAQSQRSLATLFMSGCGILLIAGGYTYLIALSVVAVVLNTAGDAWWLATVLLFSPRWLFLLPLVPLALLILFRPKLLAVIVVMAGVAAPFLGFNIPAPGATSEQPTLRVLTCNCDFHKLDANRFEALLIENQPDLIALQGLTTLTFDVLVKQAYHIRVAGEVCLASRNPIIAVDPLMTAELNGPNGTAALFRVKTDQGEIEILNVHLASPRNGLTEVIQKRWQAGPLLSINSDLRSDQARLVQSRAEQVAGPMLILGDFNTPIESRIYRREFSGYINAFSEAGFGFGSTHFTQNTGVRIDHILLSSHWSVAACWVGPMIGPDHRPVFADLILLAP